jgi:hypothetical protein
MRAEEHRTEVTEATGRTVFRYGYYGQQLWILGIGWSHRRIPHSRRLFPIDQFEYR